MQELLVYPVFKKNNLRFHKDNEAGMFMVSEEFNFLDQLKVSDVGKDIIRACNGRNSNEDIIKLLSNKYKDVSKEIIEKDMLNFLHLVWRLNIIEWENDIHPFKDIYESDDGKYRVIFTKEIDWMKNKCENMECIISPYRKNVIFDSDFLKHQYITSTQICFYNKKLDLFLFLERMPSFKYSVNLNGIAFSKQMESIFDINEFNKFLNWALNSYNQIVTEQKEVRSIFFYLYNKKIENKLFLENQLKFVELGVLENEIIDRASENIMSVLVMQKNII